MNTIGDVNNYHDLKGLQELKAAAKANPEDKAALKMAAQHFESIFIGMMLKSMRKANAVFEEGNPMHSNTTKFFRDMYDQQLATDMADQGSMGLADIIVEQLAGNSETFKPADVLRNDGSLELARENAKAAYLQNQAQLQAQLQTGQQKQSSFDKQLSDGNLAPNTPANSVNSSADLMTSIKSAHNQKTPDVERSKQISFDSPKAFVESVWDYAKTVAPKIGVHPAVMVAQSALETGWGQHILQDKNGNSSFNLFNIKALRNWDGESAAHSTLEFEGGLPVKKVEPFRVYQSFKDSFEDFADFLKSNSRYEEALNKSNEPEQFLQELQKAGYATDPNYADKIIRILNSDTFQSAIGDNSFLSPMSAGE